MTRTVVIGALALGAFTIGTTEFATMGLLPSFADAFGIGAPEASRAVSAYAVGVVIGAPAIAVLAARVRRGALLAALMLFYAATNAASAVAPTFPLFVLFRFLNGLPHGAFFGVAALVAASLVGPAERARAISRVMLGLTVATIVGVPFATALGQHLGWRSGFALVSVLALAAAVLIVVARPPDLAVGDRSPLAELGALARLQVWLTLAIGAVGFGGLFAVYTYLGPTLVHVTHRAPATLPLALGLFGIGLTVGNLVAASFADRALMPTIAVLLVWTGATELMFARVAADFALVLLAVFLIGGSGGLGTAIQTRLMDVSGDAQTLAASLMHSAFNIANAVGPAIGAVIIARGGGWASTGIEGLVLSIAGLAVWAVSAALERASTWSDEVGTQRP